MKIYNIKIILCLVTVSVYGICASPTWAQSTDYWEKTFGEGVGNSVQQTSDGGYIIAGQLSGSFVAGEQE